MSESLFAIVDKIPKKQVKGKVRSRKYDKLFNAIRKAPRGTKGKLAIDRKEVQNVFAGLNTRLKNSGLRNISLYIRNAKRKTVTSESGKKYSRNY